MSTLRMKTPLDVEASDDPNLIDIGWMRITTSDYSRFFWEGCRDGELRIPHCRACGNTWFYPTPRCTKCLKPAGEWIVASGDASLYSFTTVTRPLHKALADSVPYIVAVVELREGIRMMTNLRNVTEETAKIGMSLTVTFETLASGWALPCFEPTGS